MYFAQNIFPLADILLLSDIFEQFRKIGLDKYKLDPAYYISAPQLSLDAALKKTNAKLELISDPAMFAMIDDGMRGGVAMISKRYARANNPLVEGYDPTKPRTWIKGFDANNLYGWAISQYLPLSDFEWVDLEELEKIDWLAQEDEQDKGYFVKVDLEYPVHLHDSHNDYPLAPQRIQVRSEWVSNKMLDIKANYKIPRGESNTKLIPNLMDKFEYVLHYRNLKFYLEHGLLLKKVHAAIRFTQAPWLASYIAVNQEARAKAKSDFESEFYKLMNNAMFGKTCENQKKRTNIRLVQTFVKMLDLVAKPNFRDVRIFGEDLAAVELQKTQVEINKPFYAGFTILDLSKLHMYKYANYLRYVSFRFLLESDFARKD